MKDKNEYIKRGVSVVMAVLITAIIIILAGLLIKNGKSENLTTQAKNGLNQVESTLDSTSGTNAATGEADATTATNSGENGSSLLDNNTAKNDSTGFTSNNLESEKSTNNQIDNKNPHKDTQNNFQNSTQGSTQKTTVKASGAYNPNINTTAAKENTTENRKNFKCYIAIYCKTILDNMENLNSSKKQYVPANGVILEKLEVTVYENETVFDVLKRVCKQKGIQIEYIGGTAFQTAYVSGINNLYEFDCGNLSGWKYCVNGEYPAFGCDQYVLKSKDVIEWNYTCTMDDL